MHSRPGGGIGSSKGDLCGWLCLLGLVGPKNSNQMSGFIRILSSSPPHCSSSLFLHQLTAGYLSLVGNYLLKSKAKYVKAFEL